MEETSSFNAPIGRQRASQTAGQVAVIVAASALILFVFVLNVKVPSFLLVSAGGCGALLYLRALAADDKFMVLATNLLYIPFSKVAPFDIAKGVNLTNILVLSLFARYVIFSKQPGTGDSGMRRAVHLILFFIFVSFFHALIRSYSSFEELSTYLVQLTIPWLFYLGMTACLTSMKDVKLALLLSWIGYSLVTVYGFHEFLDKRWNASIEKSRVKGTLDQPNSYAGFMVYFLPVMGAFLFYPGMNLKVLLVLSILLAVKVLFSTFSRGACLALGGSALVMAYFKGRVFFVSVIAGAVLIVILFPGVIPESVAARFGQTLGGAGTGETADISETKLDASSADRLLLWSAARKMIAESPLLGKGLLSFPKIVESYLDREVKVRDTHNMFLKIAVYMGLPTLGIYLYFIGRTFLNAWRIMRRSADPFRRSIGLGAMGVCISILITCMFGSRLENIELVCYFMTVCAIVSFLSQLEEVQP